MSNLSNNPSSNESNKRRGLSWSFLKFRSMSDDGRVCIIEKVDKDFLLSQASIAFKEWEKHGLSHQGPLRNLVGLIAEYAFDGLLDKMRVRGYEWNKRKPGYWDDNADRRPWDFRLSNGLTFEIGSAMPLHRYAILKQAGYKIDEKIRSEIFVQVKIRYLDCFGKMYAGGKEQYFVFSANNREAVSLKIIDATNLTEADKAMLDELETEEKNAWAAAEIMGFDETARIVKSCGSWRFGEKGEFPTTERAGWYEPLNALKSFQDLRKLIEKANVQRGLFESGNLAK